MSEQPGERPGLARPSSPLRIGGIVLCGGYSLRMGTPKPWLPFGKELMLQRVVRIVREVVEPVVVVAAPGQDVPPLPDEVQIVRDEVEGCGPLGGLAAGLAALEDKADAAYLSSCDVPLLQPEFVRAVVSLLGNASACVLRAEGRLHPLAAVYRLAVLPSVREMLVVGNFRMTDLLSAIPSRIITAEELAYTDQEFLSLRNVNTPEEYAEALRALNRP